MTWMPFVLAVKWRLQYEKKSAKSSVNSDICIIFLTLKMFDLGQ